MLARTLGPKGVDCDVPHWLGRRTKTHPKVWKPSLSRRVLKPRGEARKESSKKTISASGGGEARKEKPKEDNIC